MHFNRIVNAYKVGLLLKNILVQILHEKIDMMDIVTDENLNLLQALLLDHLHVQTMLLKLSHERRIAKCSSWRIDSTTIGKIKKILSVRLIAKIVFLRTFRAFCWPQ